MTPFLRNLLTERDSYAAGSDDWDWRNRAAWKIAQMHDRVPCCDWTEDAPAAFCAPMHRSEAA